MPGLAVTAKRPNLGGMDLPEMAPAADPVAQARADRRRLINAFLASAGFVALLAWIHLLQDWWGGLAALALRPRDPLGLVGVLTAPLLHGSVRHLVSNALPLLVLGTLALVVYPRASRRAIPLIWVLSGLTVWLIGRPPAHIGASGLAHGLMFYLFVLAILRRDRPAVAAGMIAFFLYGGMLLSVLPQEQGVSWEYHLAGAIGGILTAVIWRGLDPPPARKRYSWEEEEDGATAGHPSETSQFEPPRPADVPVLWHRAPPSRGVVLRFPPQRREDEDRPPGSG